MAKEIQQDEKYKEDTKNFVSQAQFTEMNAISASNIVGVDKATGGVIAYFFTKMIWWFTHPMLGMKQSRKARVIFYIATGIVASIVITMFILGVCGDWENIIP